MRESCFMKIIKGPTYPETNRTTCTECSCEFQYFNNEVQRGGDDFMGGYGSWSTIKCPGCSSSLVLDFEFYEYEDWVNKLLNWFDRILLRWRKEK